METLKDFFDNPTQAYFYVATVLRLAQFNAYQVQQEENDISILLSQKNYTTSNSQAISKIDKGQKEKFYQEKINEYIEVLPNLLKTNPEKNWPLLFANFIDPEHFAIQKKVCQELYGKSNVSPLSKMAVPELFRDIDIHYSYPEVAERYPNTKPMERMYQGFEFKEILKKAKTASWEDTKAYLYLTLPNIKIAQDRIHVMMEKYSFKAIKFNFENDDLSVVDIVNYIGYFEQNLQRLQELTGIEKLGFGSTIVELSNAPPQRPKNSKNSNTYRWGSYNEEHLRIFNIFDWNDDRRASILNHEWFHSFDNWLANQSLILKQLPPQDNNENYLSLHLGNCFLPKFKRLVDHLYHEYENKSIHMISKNEDEINKKDYFAEPTEMLARSFQSLAEKEAWFEFERQMPDSYRQENEKMWKEFFQEFHNNPVSELLKKENTKKPKMI